MKNSHKLLLGTFAALALSLAFSEPAHAQGRLSLGMETDLDTASLLVRIRGPFSLGVRFGISNSSPAPMLRYTVSAARSLRFFFHAEARGFELGRKGKGGGIDDFGLGLGAEFIIKRRLSLFGVVTNRENFLGLQFYF